MYRKYFEIVLLVVLCLAASCSRNTIPALSGSRKGGNFDTATFEYVYAEAVRQKLLGNPADALKYLEKCLEINPLSDAAYYQMAQITLQLADAERAKAYAFKASMIDEKNIWYLKFLAGIYYQERKPDSALVYYEKAVKLYPDNQELRLTLGNFYSDIGKYQKANEIYEYFEKKFGINEKTTILYIRSLINSGDLEAAETRTMSLLGESPDEMLYNGILAEIYRKRGENNKADEVYRKLLAVDASNPQTLLSYCDFMIAEKQYENLFTLLNIVALNDKVTLESKIALLSKLVETEELVKTKGEELELALRIFEESEKNKEIIILVRPELYQKMGEKDKAVKRLEEIIKGYPDYYYAWETLLILYSEAEDYEKLLVTGKECATKFNMSYPAKVLYARAATEKGLYDIALEELRKAKIIAGNQKEFVVQVQTMEADVYYRKGEYDKCFEIFREALKNDPEDLIVLNNYAYFLAEQNRDLKEAEKMIKFVIEREKENNTYLDTYAWVLYKKGRVKEAIKIMDDIMKRDKAVDAEWYEHYGYMMKAIHKCDIAIEYWNKVLEVAPERKVLIKEIENCKK